MKQVFAKSGNVVLEDVPVPVCNEGEVLVANACSAISAGIERSLITKSESSRFRRALMNPAMVKKAYRYFLREGAKKTLDATKGFREALTTLGYSSAGVVIGVGNNIVDINVGDMVACAGVGKANHAEVVAVPRNLVAKIPDGVDFEEAAFTTLGAIAMHGIRRAGRQFGEAIAILGVGLLGQLAVQIGKAAGYKIIALDMDSERVKLAKSMGADLGLVVGKHDLEKEVFNYTNGMGADAAVIYAATPSDEPVQDAARILRKKGRVVVVGHVDMHLQRSLFYEKELDFLMSRSYGPGRYDPTYEEDGVDYPIEYVRWTENRNMQAFLDLLKDKNVDLKPIINFTFPIEEATKAYDVIRDKEKNPLGVLLKYDFSKYFTKTGKALPIQRAIEISPRIVKEKINTAVIGAGKFAKDILLPLLRMVPDYNLKAIVSATGINAKKTALKYEAECYTTDYKEVLEDENVNLVIITTPHNLHYPMIVESAKAGKAIYVEKPMCLTEGELENIVEVISETRTPLIVGFNRRYSPLTVKVKELLSRLQGPYLINYRVNAGRIPTTHWVQNPKIGGGRIIGECGHFFDLFNYLVGSQIKKTVASSIPVNSNTVIANDNFTSTLEWSDGSLTTLTYTALGNKDLSKEYVEIFADGSTMIIDDFTELRLYGLNEKDIKLKKQDKGHHQELIELAKFLRGQQSKIISFEDCVKAMRISFEVEKLTRTNES